MDENLLFHGDERVIAIEGNPGSGKTTLIKRYAWQWATKQGDKFINNLDLVIVCVGSSIDQNKDIETSIKAFLLEYAGDTDGLLYDYYTHHKDSCLLIFEAMDEASEETRAKLIRYVRVCQRKQPIIITARNDCFEKECPDVDLLFERTGFTMEEALEYMKDTFPDEVVIYVKDMVISETITSDFLSSPYNCQGLGVLLVQENELVKKKVVDKIALTCTDLVKSIFAEKLKKVNMKTEDAIIKQISYLALWATIEDKHMFSEAELNKFNLFGVEISPSLLLKHAAVQENMYTFPHEIEKEYLAAVAVADLKENRDAFYQVLASERKHAAVLRFISGLLPKDRIENGNEFQMIFAHAKLLSSIKNCESPLKNDILHHALNEVRDVLESFTQGTVSRPLPNISEETDNVILSAYGQECDYFIRAEFSEDERQSFLDGDTGKTCFSRNTLNLFEDFYLRLRELSIPNKTKFDMVQRIIGKGLRYVYDTSSTFPIFHHNIIY